MNVEWWVEVKVDLSGPGVHPERGRPQCAADYAHFAGRTAKRTEQLLCTSELGSRLYSAGRDECQWLADRIQDKV